MKPQIKLNIYYFFLYVSYVGFSQTSITNKDYEVTDDVVKVEVHNYKVNKLDHISKGEHSSIETYEFKNGFISKKTNQSFYSSGNTTITKLYEFNESREIYAVYDATSDGKKIEQTKETYKLVDFAGSQFYLPTNQFKIIKNIPNKKLEYQYADNFGASQNASIKSNDDNTIEIASSSMFGTFITVYDLKKRPIKSPGYTSTTYTYGKDGLLIETVSSSIGVNVFDFYFYDKDENENWVKKIRTHKSDEIYYSSRKLTYKNGKTTGSTSYNLPYIQDLIKKIDASVYKNYIEENEDNSKKLGCISGDCQNGFGKFTFNNGDIYEGDFKSGNINGQGKFTFADGDVYEGSFRINERSGFGTYTYTSGNKYVGNWENNQQNGKGILYDFIAGKKQEAIYKEGKIEQIISTTDISIDKQIKNTKPNGFIWKKNSENTEVWLSENGVVIEGTVFFVDKTLYFYETKKDNIYRLDNFNAQTANTYHNAVKLPYKYPHGAWTRWDSQGSLQAVNAKGEIIRGYTIFKNAANNIDVIYKGKGETETLFFKGYHNAKIKEVLPAQIYNSTPVIATSSNNTKSSAAYTSSFQNEINECKNKGVKCLVNKITDKYTTLKNEGISDEHIYTKLAEDFNSICAYNPKAMFEVIFNMSTTILPLEKSRKIIAKMSAEQKVNLKAYAAKLSDDYYKTHTNEVPESLKNSVRKQ